MILLTVWENNIIITEKCSIKSCEGKSRYIKAKREKVPSAESIFRCLYIEDHPGAVCEQALPVAPLEL